MIGATFRHIIAHNNDKMGIFGAFNSFVVRIPAGCWEAFVAGISKCSGVKDSEDGEANSLASPPPPYTVSPFLYIFCLYLNNLLSH